ncbi:EF-hand domain-containing protein [Meloidogyne graminicola]|uniref:EF-hand domain-containing protein n=1 Tax=Meloidogyne graminicola TaxID=189291 RepID=A0A8S9ZRM2_9BILA|nr:EF-hand domain-containing protein [Meloidogyne graminicola]
MLTININLIFFFFCFTLNKYFLISVVSAPAGITPIPMEMLNPHLTEFRRMDANNDDQISFSEFLQSDRPWMETLSRRYHQLDGNSDGKVSRKEFETFFKAKDEAADKERLQNDNFFKQLTVTVGPIVEREKIGNESRMRYFSAGARKFASIAHGTGIFPPPSSSLIISSPHSNNPLQSTQSEESLLPASSLIRDHEQQFRFISEGGGSPPFPQLIASSTHHHSPLFNFHGPLQSAAQILPEGNSNLEGKNQQPITGNIKRAIPQPQVTIFPQDVSAQN